MLENEPDKLQQVLEMKSQKTLKPVFPASSMVRKIHPQVTHRIDHYHQFAVTLISPSRKRESERIDRIQTVAERLLWARGILLTAEFFSSVEANPDKICKESTDLVIRDTGCHIRAAQMLCRTERDKIFQPPTPSSTLSALATKVNRQAAAILRNPDSRPAEREEELGITYREIEEDFEREWEHLKEEERTNWHFYQLTCWHLLSRMKQRRSGSADTVSIDPLLSDDQGLDSDAKNILSSKTFASKFATPLQKTVAESSAFYLEEEGKKLNISTEIFTRTKIDAQLPTWEIESVRQYPCSLSFFITLQKMIRDRDHIVIAIKRTANFYVDDTVEMKARKLKETKTKPVSEHYIFRSTEQAAKLQDSPTFDLITDPESGTSVFVLEVVVSQDFKFRPQEPANNPYNLMLTIAAGHPQYADKNAEIPSAVEEIPEHTNRKQKYDSADFHFAAGLNAPDLILAEKGAYTLHAYYDIFGKFRKREYREAKTGKTSVGSAPPGRDV